MRRHSDANVVAPAAAGPAKHADHRRQHRRKRETTPGMVHKSDDLRARVRLGPDAGEHTAPDGKQWSDRKKLSHRLGHEMHEWTGLYDAFDAASDACHDLSHDHLLSLDPPRPSSAAAAWRRWRASRRGNRETSAGLLGAPGRAEEPTDDPSTRRRGVCPGDLARDSSWSSILGRVHPAVSVRFHSGPTAPS